MNKQIAPTPFTTFNGVKKLPKLATKRNPFFSLSSRIILAMVIVALFSSILGGLVYQGLTATIINKAFAQADENYKSGVNTWIESLPSVSQEQKDALKAQIVTSINSQKPFATGGAALVLVIKQFFWVVLVIAIVAGLSAWALGWFLTRRIVGPLDALRFASQQVAVGDFSQRVTVGGDDEVGQVAYSFNFMAQQLQGAEVKRRQLLGDVAHELKTPLSSIQGHIEALRDNLPRAKANPDAIYDIVLEDVAELDRMVSSLRTWLNAQSMLEGLDIKPLDLRDELSAVIARFEARATTAKIGLTLQLNGASKVLADRNALRQIVGNLVDNALRYTPEKGLVRIMAWPGDGERPDPTRPHRVTIAVTDNGQGIAPVHWPHLFERFYRVDNSRTRDTGGTGLGLAIVQELVGAQGGRVWLNSRVGQGTIFFVSLPA